MLRQLAERVRSDSLRDHAYLAGEGCGPGHRDDPVIHPRGVPQQQPCSALMIGVNADAVEDRDLETWRCYDGDAVLL